jgi:hypothetical protein
MRIEFTGKLEKKDYLKISMRYWFSRLTTVASFVFGFSLLVFSLILKINNGNIYSYYGCQFLGLYFLAFRPIYAYGVFEMIYLSTKYEQTDSYTLSDEHFYQKNESSEKSVKWEYLYLIHNTPKAIIIYENMGVGYIIMKNWLTKEQLFDLSNFIIHNKDLKKKGF